MPKKRKVPKKIESTKPKCFKVEEHLSGGYGQRTRHKISWWFMGRLWIKQGPFPDWAEAEQARRKYWSKP